MRLSASTFTLVLSGVIASGLFLIAEQAGASPAAMPAATSQGHDLTSLVTQMEQVVFGSTRKNTPLAQRIKNLEIHAMCRTQKGTLKARVDKLEDVIGLNHSEYLPPLAPRMDSGLEKPKVAPQSQTVSSKSSGRSTNSNSRHLDRVPPISGRQAASSVETAKPRPVLPQDVRSVLVDAIKLHHSGNLPEAEAKFREVLKLDPYNGDACFSLGSLAEGRGDLAAALGYYSAASIANPNDREAKDAFLQVQERIGQQQQGPFVNPLSVASGDGHVPVLQARAAEFTDADLPQPGVLYAQNPIPSAPIMPPNYPAAAITQPPMPTMNIGQNSPPPRHSGGTGKAVAKGLARVAVGAALNYSGLHCPLCHLLRGF